MKPVLSHTTSAVSLAPALLALIPDWRRWLGFFMATTYATPENPETRLTVRGSLLLITAHDANHHPCHHCTRCIDGGDCHS